MAKKKLSEALDSILGEMFAETKKLQDEGVTICPDSTRLESKRIESIHTKNERIKDIRPENIRIKSGRIPTTPPAPIPLDDKYYRMDNEVDDLLARIDPFGTVCRSSPKCGVNSSPGS